MKVKNYPLRYN